MTDRTIPAGAGATLSTATPTPRGRDHPRGRGGDHFWTVRRETPTGPSPRARGRPLSVTTLLLLSGTIPAGRGDHAKKREKTAKAGPSPRARGRQQRLAERGRHPGTIPAGAGRLARGPSEARSERTIPAGAGATQRAAGGERHDGEHPRGRGGDAEALMHGRRHGGASPRARGRRHHGGHGSCSFRSIPAGAGATGSCLSRWPTPREHPRGRGGDDVLQRQHSRKVGASPRARGRRPVSPSPSTSSRSIPAGAGATFVGLRRRWPSTEHPRGRGGDIFSVGFGGP